MFDEHCQTLPVLTTGLPQRGRGPNDSRSPACQAKGNNQTKTILGERLGRDTLSGIDENQTPTASPGTGGTYEFNLRLLERLKADVDYFLGPSHAEKYLWTGSVDAQIAKLREIDVSIRPEDRPEWFTTEWIDQAEQAMRTPADGGIEDALDAALSGQYAARGTSHGARPKCSTASIPRKRSATTSPRRS